MNLSLIELYGSMGGFAKGVVYTLFAMSLYSLTIMLQKWWYLRSAQKETRKFAPEFSQFLEEDNVTEAIKLAEGYKKSHVARVLGNALAEHSLNQGFRGRCVRGWRFLHAGVGEPMSARQ